MVERSQHETWNITKETVSSEQGVVASHHYLASDIGAEVLGRGGNAVDAAVATSLAIGTVEPWMSGLGGGGFMMVYLASEDKTYAVDFGMVAPRDLNPDDYPLTGSNAADLFGWPEVLENRNLIGYPSIAVPGYVAGISTAAAKFGSLPWEDLITPAVEMAETGMISDWYATLMISTAAAQLKEFPESQKVYLPDGFPPVGEWGRPPPGIVLGKLAETYRRLRDSGPRDFYEGKLADSLVSDLKAGGSVLSKVDLAKYEAKVHPALEGKYKDVAISVAPGLTAGPTLLDTFQRLGDRAKGKTPDPATYQAYAESLSEAYQHRFDTMGDSNEVTSPSCTTHISVADGEGNFVALTQTLLSLFGSKVMLPNSGVLMNNGIMWFDPRPGRPNSIQPGRKPLSNMCPTIFSHNGTRTALGASGGRRIMPAVFQLMSFLTDFGMDLGSAAAQPRIDVSGGDTLSLDSRLSPEIEKEISKKYSVERGHHGVYPSLYACPNLVSGAIGGGPVTGAAFIPSPWAKVSAPG